MEDAVLRSPNNSGQTYRLQIKQKNAHTKKRKVKTWSPQQDDQLIKLYQEYPKKWGVIASLMQDRNQNQCLHRYRRLSQLGAHKKIWSSQQDHSIVSLIKKVGKNWKLLAQIIGTKTGKQIRERFINKLDPKIKTDEWTDEEDKLILKYYSQVGSRWSQISKKLPGRPQNKIKNRFYSFIQKNYDIRYVCVEPTLSTNQKQKQKVKENILKDQKFQFSQPLNPPLRSIVLDNLCLNNHKLNGFKQIQLNSKYNETQQNQKRPRINRFRPNYSRFAEQNEKQNIYQDENEQNTNPKKTVQNQVKKENSEIPSIKQFEDQFKISDPEMQQPISRLQLPQVHGLNNYMNDYKDQIFDSNVQISHKFYIKSLIRVEQQFGTVQNRYRSIRDLVSNNQIQNNQNDLFYLSHH